MAAHTLSSKSRFRRGVSRGIPVILLAMAARGLAAPDLVVTDIWQDDGRIRFQLRNIGDAQTAQDFEVALSINASPQATEAVTSSIDVGQRYNGVFSKYVWQCTGLKDTLMVRADSGYDIKESDEGNNDRQEQWSCDVTGPQIVLGPEVTDITRTMAKVVWKTDEPATGAVRYDLKAGLLGQHQGSSEYDTQHEIGLSNLKAGQTYQYVVESADAAGNMVRSEVGVFRTLAPADTQAPKMTSLASVGDGLPMQFSAEASDNIGVDRVEFYMDKDGRHIQTDYSAPFSCLLNPQYLGYSAGEFYGERRVGARAYDLGNMTSVMTVDRSFLESCMGMEVAIEMGPWHRAYIDGETAPAMEIEILVTATEPDGYRWVAQPDNPWGRDFRLVERRSNVASVDLYIDDVLTATSYDDVATHTFVYDLNGLSVGRHGVRAVAHGHVSCSAAARSSFEIIQRLPDIAITRRVDRVGSYLEVRCTIANNGLADAWLDRFQDVMTGYQATEIEGPAGSVTGVNYRWNDRQCVIDVNLPEPTRVARGGGQLEIVYKAVPILYASTDARAFEDGRTWVDYRRQADVHGAVERFIGAVPWTWPPSGPSAAAKTGMAISNSDYLIVTCPHNLFNYYPEDEVNELLCKMAELATLRNAVLGYYHAYGVLKTAFQRGDAFAVGDTFDKWGQELFLADDAGGMIRAYNGSCQLEIQGELPIERSGLRGGDAILVANFEAGTASSPHPRDEIIIIDGHSAEWGLRGVGEVYYYNEGSATFSLYGHIRTNYHNGDRAAGGNVIRSGAVDRHEMIIANIDGAIDVHEGMVDTPTTFSAVFGPGDLFAVGNVTGDDLDEIVLADVSENRIRVYSGTGALLASGLVSDLESSDEMAVGDVWGDDREDIVVADESADQIRIYSVEPGGSIVLRTEFGLYFHSDDGLAVAEMLQGGKAEILALRGGNNDHHTRGVVEIVSHLAGETPGGRRHLDDLLAADGAWTEQLTEDFEDEGYLLIVGEIEIIPTFTASYYMANKARHERIEYTDSQYANTADDMKRPELSIGRIVGNNVWRLLKPIQASIDVIRGDVDFDQSNALVVSGRNAGPDGDSDWINFTLERYSIRDIMEDQGYAVSNQEDPDETQFFNGCRNKDAIHLAGHGHWTVWDVIDRSEVRDHFDPCDSRPLVYADSCLTGRYPETDSTMAENFLRNGASAYIGATETAISPYCKYLAEGFWGRFAPGTPAGKALKGAKRNRMGDGNYAKHNSAIFHLFGDPKLEPVSSSALLMESATAATDPDKPIEGPLSSINVNIPAYTVMPLDGYDHVSIPGGVRLLEPNQPDLPAYTVSISYPADSRIDDVRLVETGNRVGDSGLNIPLVELAIPQIGASSTIAAPPHAPQWYPQRDFEYTTVTRADGTVILVLTVYPFVYNANTGDATFCHSYKFDIDYSTPPVRIRLLKAGKPVYGLGETVMAQLWFCGSAEQQGMDVVQAAVVTDGSGRVLDGLALRTLTDVRGLGSCDLAWPTDGFEPNEYRLSVTLGDGAGNTYDVAACAFALGVRRCEVVSVETDPPCFVNGDAISIRTECANMGETTESGTLLVQVQDRGGALLESFAADINDLEAGKNVAFVHDWKATRGTSALRIVAHVQYDGRTSEALAYPAAYPRTDGDLNDDGAIDLGDVMVLAEHWLDACGVGDLAPAGGDCMMDFLDFAVLARMLSVRPW